MFHDVFRQFDCKKDIRYGYTPRRVCVCVWWGGTIIIIPRCVSDAFYRVRILEGIWGLSPLYGVSGEACGKKKNSFRAFLKLNFAFLL